MMMMMILHIMIMAEVTLIKGDNDDVQDHIAYHYDDDYSYDDEGCICMWYNAGLEFWLLSLNLMRQRRNLVVWSLKKA